MTSFSLDQAQRFLEALSSKLPGDRSFTFQTFGDGKHRKGIKELRRIRHGTLEEHADELKRLNRKGAGIFVTVNMTDGKGREEENIVQLRSAFVDADNIDLLEVFKSDPDVDQYYPNILVKSKRGYHAYWLLDRWEDKKSFTPLQLALIKKFGTDHEVRDLTRVMRLPGFFHMKDEPAEICSKEVFKKSIEEGRATMVTLDHLDTFCDVSGHEKNGEPRDGDRRGYRISRLVELLNLTVPDITPAWKKQGYKPQTSPSSSSYPPEFRLYLAENYLHRIHPPTKGSGNAHETVGSACRVGHDFSVDMGSYWPVLREWGARCNPPFIESDLQYEYDTFLKATKYPPGTKLHDNEYNREAQYKNWLRSKGFDVASTGEIYRDDNEVPWSERSDRPARFDRADQPYFVGQPSAPFPSDIPPDANLINETLDPIDEHMLKDEQKRIERSLKKKEIEKKKRKEKRKELASKGPAYLVWEDHGEPPALKKTKDGRYKVKPAYHREIAWHYLSNVCKYKDMRILHFHNDEFVEWDGISYRIYKPKVYRKKIAKFLATCAEETNDVDSSDETVYVPYKVNKNRKSEVLEALEDMVHLDEDFEAPCWLIDQQNMPDPREVIVCKNGLFDIRNGKLLKNTPSFFSNNYIAVNFDPKAPKPTRWLKFLDEVFPDDPESKRLLKWWFGYCMVQDTRQQKILMMVGRPRSGKGTCMYMLKRLVGKRAFGSMNFKALGSTFGLESAVNKSVLVFADSRVGPKTDQAAIVEALLGISGEDTMRIERKNISSIDVQLKCRIILVSNEVLNLHDTSGALGSRILMIRFTEEFKDDISEDDSDKIQDKKLKDKLDAELPGILNWAIEGWHELREEGRFIQPSSSEGFIGTFSAQSSPTNEFVEQCCDVGKNFEISTKDIFECWKLWCTEQGYKQGNQASLGRNLMSVISHLQRTRTSASENKSRPWKYRGVRLNEVWDRVLKKQLEIFEDSGEGYSTFN